MIARFRHLAIVLLALASLPLAAHAQDIKEIDAGTYHIYLRDRPMGFEQFTFRQFSDSVVVQSIGRQIVLTPAGDDSVQKTAFLSVNAFDLDLIYYRSQQLVGKTKIIRELLMSDTSYSSTRQDAQGGDTYVLARPPGRIFVHDPAVYVLFDVITRNLNRSEFDTRPITVMVLGPRDTTLEITATRLPPETIRWGQRSVLAKKLALGNDPDQLILWSDPRGRLLKIEGPASGLRVVRDPPAVKKPRRRSG